MNNKKWSARVKHIGCNVAVIAICSFALNKSAHAGFEWTPPPAKVAPAPMPPVSAAPVIEVEQMQTPEALPMNPFIEDKAANSEPEMHAAPEHMPAHAHSEHHQVAAVQMPPVPQVSYAEVAGFGSDIPLVLAMQQIVPAEYSYSFDEGINQGARVSWNGGKPWNEVLEDAVAMHDLAITISGNTVWVRHSWVETSFEKTRMSAAQPVVQPAVLDVMPMQQPVNPFSETAPLPVPLAMQAQPPAPLEPIMAVEKEKAGMAEQAAPMPMPLAVMEQEQEMPTQSYPRRNPIPFMMKHGHEDMAEVKTTTEPVVTPTPLMGSPFADAAPIHHAPAAHVPEPSEPAMNMAEAIKPIVENPEPLMLGDKQVMDPFEIRFWHAEPGDSLRDVLGDWTSSANVAMLWDSAKDYRVPSRVRMHGTFPDAVTHILMYYNQTDPRPLGRLHPNLPNGPSVLVVENYTAATQ